MKTAARLCRSLARALLLVFLVMAGSLVLIRFAPGYLSDVREMDPRYSMAARSELATEEARNGSLLQTLWTAMKGWSHGDLGRSRQFDIPVLELIEPRLALTGDLVGKAIGLAWIVAFASACAANALRVPSVLFHIPTALLLAIPASALATLSLLTETGGPVLVLTLLIAARDFKFVDRILRNAWRSPHLLQARAQGVKPWSLFREHIVPNVAEDLLSLSTLSIVMALTALVPVEVQFNVPGLGQLAWSAALNRDMPVLVTVTVIMAVAFTSSALVSNWTTEVTPV